MTKKITMRKLKSEFDNAYTALDGYDWLIHGFCSKYSENMKSCEGFKELAKKFADYRHDYISSDRECAAFYMACGRLSIF